MSTQLQNEEKPQSDAETTFDSKYKLIVDDNEVIASPEKIPLFVEMMNSRQLTKEQRVQMLISLLGSNETILTSFVSQYNGVGNIRTWMTRSVNDKDTSTQKLLLRILQKLPASPEGIVYSGIIDILMALLISPDKDIKESAGQLVGMFSKLMKDSTDQNKSALSKRNVDEVSPDDNSTLTKKPKTSKMKKKVYWPPDELLVSVKYFTKNSTVTGKDFQTALQEEIMSERAIAMIKKKREQDSWREQKRNMKPGISWDHPMVINFEGKEYVAQKTFRELKETPEQKRLREHDGNTLMAIYFAHNIPSTPEEPKEKNAIPTEYDDTTIKVIRDATAAPIDQQAPIGPVNTFGQFFPQNFFIQGNQPPIHQYMGTPTTGLNIQNSIPPTLGNNPMPMGPPTSFNTMMYNPNPPSQSQNTNVIRLGYYNIIPTLYTSKNQLRSPNDINKKFECKFYPKGNCEFGAKCKYLHIEPTMGR